MLRRVIRIVLVVVTTWRCQSVDHVDQDDLELFLRRGPYEIWVETMSGKQPLRFSGFDDHQALAANFRAQFQLWHPSCDHACIDAQLVGEMADQMESARHHFERRRNEKAYADAIERDKATHGGGERTFEQILEDTARKLESGDGEHGDTAPPQHEYAVFVRWLARWPWAPAPRVLLDALARPVPSLPSSLEGDGLVAEFGVGWGYSLATIAKHFGGGASARASGAVFGFDSFKGLPEAWRIHPQGDFSTYSTLPRVEGASLVAGWFNETIPAFFADPTNAPLLFFDGSDDATKARPARFVHIDCDLYSSTAIVLAYLGPHLRDGTLIVFDEIFGYPGFEEHELRALFEFVERTGRRLEPLALGKLAPFGDPIAASFRVW